MKGKIPIPKSQRDIILSQQSPYDKLGRGNPNINPINRGNEVTFRGDNTKPISIGFKDIDESILYYFENIIQPYVIQNNQRIKVPVQYGSQEKWKSYTKDGYYRDKNGKIMSPLILFKRNNIEKDRSIGNKMNANNPHNYYIAQKQYSKQNYYDKFNLLTNRVPVKTFYASVIPDYLIIDYSCVVFTYYVEQINKIIEAIEYNSDSYWGDKEKYQFQAKIDNFNTITEILDDKERLVSCTFNIKLRAYIVPELLQKDINSIKKFTSKAKIIIITEPAEILATDRIIVIDPCATNNWENINTPWELMLNNWESYFSSCATGSVGNNWDQILNNWEALQNNYETYV